MDSDGNDLKQQSDAAEIDLIDFSEINQAVASFDYNTANELITKSWSDECKDIRIIVYKYFCEIYVDNYDNLATHLRELQEFLEQCDKEELTPQKTIDIQIENSFKWFFKSLLEGVKAYNKKQRYTTDNVEELESEYDKLQELLSSKFEADFSTQINSAKILTAVAAELEPAEEENEEAAGKAGGGDFTLKDSEQSPKWIELKNNIIVFKQLMTEERYLEAALIYQHINKEVVNFDPRVYFPEAFFPLYEAMAENFDNVLNI